MSVNINGFNPDLAAQWKSQIGDIKAEDIKNVSFNAETRSLTLSVDNGGSVSQVALAMPELDAPATADQSKIASLCAKLGSGNLMNLSPAQVETICKEITAELTAYSDAVDAGGVPGIDTTASSKGVMFDLYALMSLLVECGQKMRDAARDVRQAENEQVQASIQAQADQQYSAAITGLVASVVVCLVQVGLQGLNLARLGKGVDQQMDARNQAGIEKAKTQLDMAEMQSKPEDAQKNLDKISEKTDPAVRERVESKFNDSAKSKANLVSNEQIEERIRINQAKIDSLTYEDAPPSQNDVKGPSDSKTPELGPSDSGANGRKVRELTPEDRKQIDELSKQIGQDTELVKNSTLEQRQALFRTQVKSELSEITKNENATEAEIKYAEAYAANEIAQNSSPNQIAADYEAALAHYNQASTMLQHNAIYLKGVQLESSSRIYGDMIMSIGNVAQGVISNISEMKRSKATEIGSEQQVAQEMLDQAKDLFSQCQSLIDSVVQLMQAVLQAEVQSMRDAIQA